MSLFSLQGKIALVTGASRGIGQHLAVELARAGADLVICARSEAPLRETARKIQALGQRCLVERVDIADIASAEAMVERVRTQWGRLDILINNAGTVHVETILDLKPADWDRVLETNLRGAVFCARACARLMRQNGGGKIVNIASIAGLQSEEKLVAYSASKAALIQFTRTAALEWARDRILVNALCPGYIVTDLNRTFLESEAGAHYIRRHIPLGRAGRPEDLTGAVLFLASPASDWVTGCTLVVDGGQTIR
ncbi:MAG: 3-oxoacyl-ACP reductase FabG [Acidobacteria bacterium]|nr:3-oxoacyl-ACP reductase FabG [Acidobacteriota bacterium]